MDFLTKLFKAMANEHRVRILYILLTNSEKEISELSYQLKLPYKTVARNLKILEQANLLNSRRWKGLVYYTVKSDERLEYNNFIYKMVNNRYNKSRFLKKVRKKK
jgi:predicted transcriptional regulator